MIIGVQASRNFDDYSVFLRAMGTALSMMNEGDPYFTIYSAGPAKLNSMALEFANVSERSLKARGIRVRVTKVPPYFIKNNIEDFAYFAYFSKPKEPTSELVKYAESKDAEVGVYRY